MLGVVGGWDGSVRGLEALATKRGEGFGVPMLPNLLMLASFRFLVGGLEHVNF
jgi:hypothetical protein